MPWMLGFTYIHVNMYVFSKDCIGLVTFDARWEPTKNDNVEVLKWLPMYIDMYMQA